MHIKPLVTESTGGHGLKGMGDLKPDTDLPHCSWDPGGTLGADADGEPIFLRMGSPGPSHPSLPSLPQLQELLTNIPALETAASHRFLNFSRTWFWIRNELLSLNNPS